MSDFDFSSLPHCQIAVPNKGERYRGLTNRIRSCFLLKTLIYLDLEILLVRTHRYLAEYSCLTLCMLRTVDHGKLYSPTTCKR